MVVAAIFSVAAPGLAAAAGPAPEGGGKGMVGGRITFRDATREARSEEVERLRWGHLTVEMRRGWEVLSARPDAAGMFTMAAAPGTYRVEYVRIGQLAEFFVPHDVEVRAGGLTCLGTIEVVVRDFTADLGNNTSSEVRVRDDCAAIGSDLKRLGGADAQVVTSVARPAPAETGGLTVMDVLVGFRAELGIASPGGWVGRGSLVVPLGEDDDNGTWLAAAFLLHLNPTFTEDRWADASLGGAGPAAAVWGGAVGAGYKIWALEAVGFGGYLGDAGRGAHGPLGGVSLRLGTFLFGVGGRGEWYASTGDSIGWLTLDISPIGLLGSLL
jgi:hypothetical protein